MQKSNKEAIEEIESVEEAVEREKREALEAELESLRARKREAAKSLEIPETLEEQVERARIEAKGEEELAKAVAKHGRKRVGVVRSYTGFVVLKRPNHIKWRQFQDNAEVTMETIESLVRDCVTYPNAARLDSMFEEIPDLVQKCGHVVVELAKGTVQDLSGK